MQVLEHIEEVSEEPFINDYNEAEIPAVVEKIKAAGVFVTTTLINAHSIQKMTEQGEALGDQPNVKAYINPFNIFYGVSQARERQNKRWQQYIKREIAFETKMTGALHEAGVSLLMGTDASYSLSIPGFAAWEELLILVDAGLSPYQALKSATVTPANAFSLPTGTIEAGKRADLVLLSSNPLENIENIKTIKAVIVGGILLDQAALEKVDIHARDKSTLHAIANFIENLLQMIF